MNVKIKKLHEDAIIPTLAKDGDAAMDLTAVDREVDKYGNMTYYTGLAMEIPRGYVGLLFPRSSVCKVKLTMSNSVGVIDSGYRGEIMCKFKNAISFNTFFENNLNSEINTYGVGERVAQIMIIPIPEITFEEVDELSDSERGTDGHGSSGK